MEEADRDGMQVTQHTVVIIIRGQDGTGRGEGTDWQAVSELSAISNKQP